MYKYPTLLKPSEYTPGDGTRTITLATAITIEQLAYVYNVTQNLLYYVPAEGENAASPVALCTISGGNIVIDTSLAVLATTDEIHIQIFSNPGFDDNLNSDLTIRQNPEYAHYTSPEHIIDDSNSTVDQHYSSEILMDSYRNIAIQLTGSSGGSGVTFKVYGTLNDSAATPADGDAAPSTDWVDLSTDVLGAATVTLDSGNSDLYFVDTNTMVYKYIIQYEPDNATNSTDIFIRRY